MSARISSGMTHQQQDALAHFEALRGGMEVFHDLGQRLLDAEDVLREELVARLTRLIRIVACGHNHVEDALVGELRHDGALGSNLEVLRERSLPGQGALSLAILF
jgi:hypothetical protein